MPRPPPKKPQRPIPPPHHPVPYPTIPLRLQASDLNHPGSSLFFSATNPSDLLSTSVAIVLSHLYPTSSELPLPSLAPTLKHPCPRPPWPGTRSTTLFLHAFSGVAYTTGTALDSDHKEIHVSLGYVANAIPAPRLTPEITGVLVHETVHAWQWDALGTAPGGLIEGIADWVRLKAGLKPPHWVREVKGDTRWDAGYAVTAWFLVWLDEVVWGKGGLVPRLNMLLRDEEYVEERFWVQRSGLGRGVGELWEGYCKWLGEQEGVGKLDQMDGLEEEGKEVVEMDCRRDRILYGREKLGLERQSGESEVDDDWNKIQEKQ